MAARSRPWGRFLRLLGYRVGQAVAGTFGRLDPAAAAAAAASLPPNLRPLFLAMRPRDQRHAIGVLRRVGAAPEVLRQAALLHDVGKVQAYLGTAGRTVVVLAASTGTTGSLGHMPWIGTKLANYTRHPEVGAEMLRAAGASPDLVEIVAEHQVKHPRRADTRLLQDADGGE